MEWSSLLKGNRSDDKEKGPSQWIVLPVHYVCFVIHETISRFALSFSLSPSLVSPSLHLFFSSSPLFNFLHLLLLLHQMDSFLSVFFFLVRFTSVVDVFSRLFGLCLLHLISISNHFTSQSPFLGVSLLLLDFDPFQWFHSFHTFFHLKFIVDSLSSLLSRKSVNKTSIIWKILTFASHILLRQVMHSFFRSSFV